MFIQIRPAPGKGESAGHADHLGERSRAHFAHDLAAMNADGDLAPSAKRYKVTPGAVTIAWTLRNPAVSGAIVGVRSAQQVDGVIGATEIELKSNDLLEIEQVAALQAA
jgi:aryl-alcohol dehydrogenase-like predicted oxidoreductase